ncbi:MAG: protein-glutamate O-methyltransferase CheR [Beijerinckiaceae bacterium]
MTEKWFTTLRQVVETRTGVSIDADKQYLAESRLSSLVSKFGAASIQELVDQLAANAYSDISRSIVEAMMTGETFFFRDVSQFNRIRDVVIPELIALRQQDNRLRIWCAACSTGQEPYSIAMMLDEMASELRGWRIDIVASDVSESAVERARQGYYNQFEVQRGLPVTSLLRYFHRDGDNWRIAENLRSRIEFVSANILTFRQSGQPFDLVLCRNVLMYFETETRQEALRNIDENLALDGWIVLGTSESGILKNSSYASTREFPAICRKSAQTFAKEGVIARNTPAPLVLSLAGKSVH